MPKMKHDQIYDQWNSLKKNMDKAKKYPPFREGQIWWAGIGRNVGVEIYGKGKNFLRPVLILKRNNRLSFMAIPLTSQEHNGPQYMSFSLRGRYENAILSQAKVMSSKRLYYQMGELDVEHLEKIKKAFIDFYAKNNLSRPKQRESWVVRRRHPQGICKFISHIHKLIISHFAKKVNP